jgi:hypothetical protein
MLLLARVEQSEPFYHLHIPVLTTVRDHSQVGTVSQKRRFTNQCIPAGYPETHVSIIP